MSDTSYLKALDEAAAKNRELARKQYDKENFFQKIHNSGTKGVIFAKIVIL